MQAKLRQLRADAAALQMTIDPMTNAVVPSSTFKGLPIEALIAEEQLQPGWMRSWGGQRGRLGASRRDQHG
ncbi:hypothetical protein I553_9273 [Mycobacterium xenopi 4042]|uniref:Uncharacterized protein n=1 Tax=Mycobacterium xenopi 4042 TaxID=1299334 RepID=X7ZMW1_MYCXE|nr:hypothetical protein I553_9273 [Mycobacterium xenopi 4042]